MPKTLKKKTEKLEGQVIINEISVGQLNRGNQSIDTWIQNVKSAERIIRPTRKALLETYLDAEIDLHLSMVESKRIRAVKTCPWLWEELDNDKVKENFRSPWFFEFMGQVMDVVFKGHEVIEFVFKDGLVSNTEPIPRQNVDPLRGLISREMWAENASIESGWLYREGPLINYMLEVGKARDLGLYKRIIPYILLKRGNLSDYARFNEMFGMPLRVYEYDPNNPKNRAEVTQQAEKQGAAAYIVVPRGTGVNFHEANQTGASTTYKDFHQIMNDEVTIGVLGQKLTTDSNGKGSYALGNVHKEVEEALTLEDRMMVEYIMNYPLKHNILIPHGYPLEGITGAFQVSEELPKDKKFEMWIKMDQRIPISDEDFYTEFGVPKPDEAAIKRWQDRQPIVSQPGGAEPEPGK